MMDPLDFLPDLVEDSISPRAHSVMAYPIAGEGTFCGQNIPQHFEFTDSLLADSLTAWGKVGFGLYAEDFMQGSYNRYGIRRTTLLVDGTEVFRSEVDNIPVAENKMVNVWGDYDYFVKHQQRSKSSPASSFPPVSVSTPDGTAGRIPDISHALQP